MIWALAHRRADGSFLVTIESGDLYQVTPDDPIFPAVQAAAEGVDLPPEPPPVGLQFVDLSGGANA